MQTTSSHLPKEVLLREDGPREGFQMLKQVVSTEKKAELIERLSQTGIKSIEVTAFVRPDKVPQHADAKELVKQLKHNENVRYRALYLNEKGLSRALELPQLDIEGYIMLAASDAFLQKNNNLTLDKAISEVDLWLERFAKFNLPLERLMLSTAFGDAFEGYINSSKVISIIDKVMQKIENHKTVLEEVTLADTTGWANPRSVQELVLKIKEQWPNLEIGLHLHDTRGCGMANVLAALQVGVSRFDCSVGGMGGCPFAKGAAGNVPTEDVAFLCEELGIHTGLDLNKYIECAKFAEEITGTHLPGKLKEGGNLSPVL